MYIDSHTEYEIFFFSYKGGGSFSDEKELFDELEILASLFPHPHPNIVNLVGGSTFGDGKECRVEKSRVEWEKEFMAGMERDENRTD